MRNAPRIARRGLFALALAGALGFGATQVVATPQPKVDQARSCNPICEPDCQGFGGELRGWTCLCCG